MLPSEFLISERLVYSPLNFISSSPVLDKESAEYGALQFKLNSINTLFRVSKVTPKKVGQFVTLWKRVGQGPIQPYDVSDEIGLVIVFFSSKTRRGQFVFPKSLLCQHDVFSVNGQGGKRAMRVYSPWDNVLSRQAKKTQAWQSACFLELPFEGGVNISHVMQLYGAHSASCSE